MLASVTVGCASLPERFSPLPHAPEIPDAGPGELVVTFLGAGGVFLQSDELSLLADPFFTNTSMWSVLWFNDDRPNHEQVARWLPPTDSLAAILVSHSHYDHAMDVPAILEKVDWGIPVYGNLTLVNTLASLPSADIRNVTPATAVTEMDANTREATTLRPGAWIQIAPRLRVLPIRSSHPPHLFGHTFGHGDVLDPQESLPDKALKWLDGEVYSFVIDFLAEPGDTKPAFRIFYQSSAATLPMGQPPDWVLEERHPFDLAIVAAASFHHETNYPEELLNLLDPKRVMVVHWDDLFDEYESAQPGRVLGLWSWRLPELASGFAAGVADSVPVYWPDRGASLKLTR